MEKQIIEKNKLIANRVPPSDRWRLIDNGPEGPIHTSLTDTLEAYMVKTEFRGEYRLAPLKGELYAIKTTEEEIQPEPIKQFSIYGEY
jgi:hypothetical protein